MLLKKISISLFTLTVLACSKDNTTTTFDDQVQYETEKKEIWTYLDTHYYDVNTDAVKSIDNSQTALHDVIDSVLVQHNNVNYYLYQYTIQNGVGESPDANDVVNVNYKGFLTNGTVFDENDDFENQINLFNTIVGWQQGMGFLKGGVANESNLEVPRTYSNIGEGLLVIPSGLAYRNSGSGSIGANQTLVFNIDLKFVSKYD